MVKRERNGPGEDARWSHVLWGLRWSETLPWPLADEVRLEYATPAVTLAFVRAHYPEIFETEGRRNFVPDPMTPAKKRFLDHCDAFVFVDAQRVVGVLLGHPLDWTSYYWRTVALLPAYRGRGCVGTALNRLDPVLSAAGVHRLHGDTSPDNLAQLRLLQGLGWRVTGSMNSDRWGALLQLTKFLSPDSAATFARQYSAAPLRTATSKRASHE